jgi:tol-pal system protein YbgF
MQSRWMRRSCYIFLFFSLLAGGCATRSEIVEFKDRLAALTEDSQESQRAQARSDSLTLAEMELLYEIRAELTTRLESFEERLQVLENQLRESEGPPAWIPQGPPLPDTLEREVPPEETTPGADRLQVYNAAYMDMTRGNYDLAIAGFKEYLRLFPGSDLADDAQYNIGVCYYAKKEFGEALVAFENIVRDAPQGNQAASALYRLGLTYLELHNGAKAGEYLRRVVAEHPAAPEADLARERLKSIP